MALFENGWNVSNIALGAAVAVLAPAVLPVIGGMVRPAAKAAIKGGILVYDMGKEMVSGAMEAVGDITEEAKSEVHGGKPEKKPGK